MGGMVRYIWCPECVERLEKAEPYPDDGLRTVRFGTVTLTEFVCDFCNKPLPPGASAAAVSMYDRTEDYRPWEDEFLVIEEPERQ